MFNGFDLLTMCSRPRDVSPLVDILKRQCDNDNRMTNTCATCALQLTNQTLNLLQFLTLSLLLNSTQK